MRTGVAIAALFLILAFGVLFVGRLATARRAFLRKHLLATALGAGAVLFLLRGGFALAALLALGALLAWSIQVGKLSLPPAINREDQAARALLGVGPQATPEEIRAAFRAKIAMAHPDRGGDGDQAARLMQARDRLLRRS